MFWDGTSSGPGVQTSAGAEAGTTSTTRISELFFRYVSDSAWGLRPFKCKAVRDKKKEKEDVK
jgi:hypothetical protein